MFLLLTTLIGFAVLCAAQLQNLPDCAKPCAASLPTQCHLGVECICQDADWISGISCCVSKQCPPSDQLKTLNVAQQLCGAYNVKLPSAASCPASAGATAAVSSAGGNSIATSSAPAATSAVSGAETTSPGSASGASITSTPTTGSSSSTTASSSSSATQASGAAQVLGSNIGAVGAAVAALAFL